MTAVLRRPRGAALAAALLAVALAALALPRTARANHSQPTIFDAPRELRSYDAKLRERTLDEISSLGARWIRVVVYWHDVAPAGSFSWKSGRLRRPPPGATSCQ